VIASGIGTAKGDRLMRKERWGRAVLSEMCADGEVICREVLSAQKVRKHSN